MLIKSDDWLLIKTTIALRINELKSRKYGDLPEADLCRADDQEEIASLCALLAKYGN